MSFPGRINVYRCRECKGEMVTLDIDVGDTPVLTLCQLRRGPTVPRCGGSAKSEFYECDQKRLPLFAWCAPVDANGVLRLLPITAAQMPRRAG